MSQASSPDIALVRIMEAMLKRKENVFKLDHFLCNTRSASRVLGFEALWKLTGLAEICKRIRDLSE